MGVAAKVRIRPGCPRRPLGGTPSLTIQDDSHRYAANAAVAPRIDSTGCAKVIPAVFALYGLQPWQKVPSVHKC